jgi:hypothetical protein
VLISADFDAQGSRESASLRGNHTAINRHAGSYHAGAPVVTSISCQMTMENVVVFTSTLR